MFYLFQTILHHHHKSYLHSTHDKIFSKFSRQDICQIEINILRFLFINEKQVTGLVTDFALYLRFCRLSKNKKAFGRIRRLVKTITWEKNSCRGRDRTSTRQLAAVQSSVVDPGRIPICIGTRLYAAFILLSSHSRQEGMSAKNFITPQYL